MPESDHTKKYSQFWSHFMTSGLEKKYISKQIRKKEAWKLSRQANDLYNAKINK